MTGDGDAESRTVAVDFLSPSMLPRSVRVVDGVAGGTVNLVLSASVPHLLLYGAVRRDPPTMARLGASDQGADQGPDSVVRST